MTLVAPARNEPIIRDGFATTRFANLLEDTATDVNSLIDVVPLDIQDETGGNITFVLDDAFTVRVKSSGDVGQQYIIPAIDDVAFELGTWIEIFNDSGQDISVLTDDLLESTESGATEGTRTIATGGWGRLLLIDVDTPLWKITGDQIT